MTGSAARQPAVAMARDPEPAGVAVVIVVAMDEGGLIGNGSGLPWHISDELRHFRQLTIGKPVVMGRRTWNSLPIRPLPGRLNIVLSRTPGFRPDSEDTVAVPNLEAALDRARLGGYPEAMVIGGREVFEEALPQAVRIHMTLVHGRYEGDVRFPEGFPDFDGKVWRKTQEKRKSGDPAWTALTLKRRVRKE